MAYRTCSSDKFCSKCSNPILAGTKYWSSPNKGLCVPCYNLLRTEGSGPVQGFVFYKGEDNVYRLKGTCEFCEAIPRGVFLNRKVCAAHVSNALESL